jgi:hypothetical protein
LNLVQSPLHLSVELRQRVNHHLADQWLNGLLVKQAILHCARSQARRATLADRHPGRWRKSSHGVTKPRARSNTRYSNRLAPIFGTIEGECSPSNSRSLFKRSSICAGSFEWSTGSTLRRRSPISMKMAQLSTALRGIRFGIAEIQSMISRWTKASHLQIVSAHAA